MWIALDPAGAGAHHWLHHEARLDEQVVSALVAYDTRPRCLVGADGALLILRGIDIDPRSNPTDLVSVRAWIEDNRVITVQHRKLATVDALRAAYEAGEGPKSSAELIVALAGGLIERIRGVVNDFETEIDSLEDESVTGQLPDLRRRIHVRHGIVPLRRYLAPQRDAFSRLMAANLPWLDNWWKSHLRETADEVSLYIDAFDAIRESAHIVQDTLSDRISERTNKMIVLLSIGAAAFFAAQPVCRLAWRQCRRHTRRAKFLRLLGRGRFSRPDHPYRIGYLPPSAAGPLSTVTGSHVKGGDGKAPHLSVAHRTEPPL